MAQVLVLKAEWETANVKPSSINKGNKNQWQQDIRFRRIEEIKKLSCAQVRLKKPRHFGRKDWLNKSCYLKSLGVKGWKSPVTFQVSVRLFFCDQRTSEHYQYLFRTWELKKLQFCVDMTSSTLTVIKNFNNRLHENVSAPVS